jgi:transposase
VTQTAPHAVLTTLPAVFFASLELSAAKWKIAFSGGDRPKLVTIDAKDWKALDAEIARARQRFGVQDNATLFTCYEAGRDGFWIHRELEKKGIKNIVVDPSSIEVSRRARRAKTDSLDAIGLVEKLVKYVRGDKSVWAVAKVPSVEVEDARRLHRERDRLTKERTGHTARVKSLLALVGLSLKDPRRFDAVEAGVPPTMRAEIKRELKRLTLVDQQMKELTTERAEAVRTEQLPNAKKIKQLEELKAIGPTSATVLVSELFGWRDFKNGKQVGSCAGLTPTPYSSGKVEREQGISRAGNRRVRTLCVEIAWLWVRYQPDSTLTKWFNARFAKGGGRSRRLGIVALARKLLVALWRYLKDGVVPEGAIVKA